MPLSTILIEDHSIVRESLIPALAEIANVEVIAVAETANEGIAVLTTHSDRWRLAVVDMFLKDGNGLEVLRACRERRGDQHMLVLTNFATLDMRQRAKVAGADAVFDKSTELDLFFDLCKGYSEAQDRPPAGG